MHGTSLCSISGLDLAPVHPRGAGHKQGSEPQTFGLCCGIPPPELCLLAAQAAFLLW